MKLHKRALITVTDKGCLNQIKRLSDEGWEIVSTGNTANTLENLGVECIHVEDFTGFPEMLDGRLKTLHPKIFGGILADQNNPEHLRQILEQNIELFGIVVVNLYTFDQKPGIENIDIGGPSLLRAAAKNHTSIAVLSDPDDYEWVIDEILENDGEISIETLEELAARAFEVTAQYDTMISDWIIQRKLQGLPLNDGSSIKH